MEKKKIKVALVVGHRKYKPGAYGSCGVSEFGYNSKLAQDIADNIAYNSSINIEVKIFYRDNMPGGYGEKMRRLHKRIDRWGADYSISMHFNAYSDIKANGHLVLYCSKKGKEVAQMMDAILDKRFKNRDRNIERRSKAQRGGSFLCNGMSVCILVEPFFASHQCKFRKGTKRYRELIFAYVELIEELANV